MSFGSYQQFCEQRRHTLAAAAAAASGHGTGDGGLGFDMHLPSRYPPVGSTSSPGMSATNFYGAAPGVSMQPPHVPHQLPSSFFTSQDPASQSLPGNRKIAGNITNRICIIDCRGKNRCICSSLRA